MREESRFDPDAVSPAAAHGLTQFVLPTARRFAAAVGRAHLGLADLHRPEVAIALGAAYLAELDGQFAGERHAVLAAYNAGEPQARLWQSYCFSREAPEYASKIGFRQTRDYVRKVLRGWAVYRELYADSP
jgi:soluble lytic murein transglycosylase